MTRIRGPWLGRWGAVAALLGGVVGSVGVATAGPGGKGALEGVVEDEARQPIEGAEVVLEAKGKTIATTRTDANGAFAVTGTPTGDATLRVRKLGFQAHGESLVIAGKGVTRTRASLRPGVHYGGKVVDGRGAPVEGASVYVVELSKERPRPPPKPSGSEGGSPPEGEPAPVPEEGPSAEPLPGEGETAPETPLSSAGLRVEGRFAQEIVAGPATTPADGTFRFDVAPGKGYGLRVLHPRHVPLELPDLPGEGKTVKEGIPLTLVDAAWVTGVVADAAGKPVAGVKVGGAPDFFWPIDLNAVWSSRVGESFTSIFPSLAVATTDAKGRYTLGGFSEPKGVLTFDHPDFLYATQAVEGLVVGQARGGFDVRLERATGTVEGTVVGLKGKPVVKAWVAFESRWGDATAETDAAGRFKLTKIRSKEPITVHVSATDLADVAVEGVALGTKGLKISMEPAPRWKALVTDVSGVPVPRLMVRVRRTDGVWRARRGSDVEFQFLEQTAAGLDVVLPVGKVEVVLSASGFQEKKLGPFDTKAGTNVEPGAVTLERSK